jgi:hypothetical protein
MLPHNSSSTTARRLLLRQIRARRRIKKGLRIKVDRKTKVDRRRTRAFHKGNL